MMMNRLYTLLLLACCAVCFAQQETPDCGFYGNKTVEERNAMFPFNKAKKVVLVSYPSIFGKGSIVDTLETMKKYDAIKKVDFKLGKRQQVYLVKEEAMLSPDWVDKLSNLLVNYILKEEPEGGVYAGVLCYQPRNSILFYDEQDSIICCFEICFTCGNGGMWPNPNELYDSNVINYCPEGYKLLKLIFSENEILYGLEEQ